MQISQFGRIAFWMLGALLAFSGTAVAIRELSHALSLFEILTIRTFGGVVILTSFLLWKPALRFELVPRLMHLHLLRGVTHFAAQYGWAMSIQLLPLATAFAIEFTMPIWVALLAVLFLGEQMTSSRAISIALGFLGVLVVVRPGLATFQPASLIMLLAAFGFAVNAIFTKKLTRVATTFTILFWMNLVQLPLAAAGSDPDFVFRITMADVPAALGFAVTGLMSHYCLTNAFRAGDASVVVTLDFLRIPLIALVGWLLYGESLDLFVFAGAGLIITGVLWNLRAESRGA